MDLFSGNDNNQFSLERVQNGTKEFLESNSMIARLSFILLLLLVFIVLYSMCIFIFFANPILF